MGVNLEDVDEKELSDTFDMLDVDRDGCLSRTEIAVLFRTVHVEPTRVELDFIFQEMDQNHTGKITKSDFIAYMRSPPVHRTTLKELELQFKHFDKDGDGFVSLEEMATILADTCGLTDPLQVRAMFEATDKNHDNRVSFREFVAMMSEEDR